MRVLMLHNRYLVPGGEEQATAAEVALLRDYSHEVELLEHDNQEIQQLGKARTSVRTLWSSDSYHRIYNKLSKENFDILHVQNFFPLWSPSVYYAASRAGIPVVQTLHNYRLMCVNATFFRDNRVCEDCLGKTMPWPGVVHACYRESRAASAVLAGMVGFHKLLNTWKTKVQMYIAVSEFAREKHIAGSFPAEKIMVRPNFVYPSPQPGNGGGGYALYVGRLSAEKGIATMLQAWQAAENPIPLKVIGDGPLSNEVMAAAATSSTIQYLGRKTSAEVLDSMRGAEFFVFPSECYETMGRTIIEAFAVGTPVVASSLGPRSGMVVSGKTGFLFPSGDVAALRQQVEWCSRNLQEVHALRRAARAEFEEKYTGARAAELLVEIYRSAMNKISNHGDTEARRTTKAGRE
jgi:glycosyltransferase involved in cell wall biosynthesis